MPSRRDAPCYVPLRHEGLAEQVPLAAAIAALGPVLTDRSTLKIYQNAKFDMLVMERAGFPPSAPFDDAMLISYAQEAGMHGHGLDELSQLHLGHTPISYDEVTGTGRNRVPFSQVPIERATAYAAEDADVDAAAVAGAAAAAALQRRARAVRAGGAPAAAGAAGRWSAPASRSTPTICGACRWTSSSAWR